MTDLAESRMDLAKLCADYGILIPSQENMEEARKFLEEGPPISTQCGAQRYIDEIYNRMVEKYNHLARDLREKGIEARLLEL